MAVSLLFVQFHVSAQSNNPPALPPPDTNAPAPVLTLIPPPPPSATLEYDSGSPTNHFYLVLADQLTSNTVTFSNLTPGVPYGVIVTRVDPTTGLESSPSPLVKFILPANTPILSFDSTHAIIRATVMQASTLQTSPDLRNWADYAALQTNCINTWDFLLADNPPPLFFRINLNPQSK